MTFHRNFSIICELLWLFDEDSKLFSDCFLRSLESIVYFLLVWLLRKSTEPSISYLTHSWVRGEFMPLPMTFVQRWNNEQAENLNSLSWRILGLRNDIFEKWWKEMHWPKCWETLSWRIVEWHSLYIDLQLVCTSWRLKYAYFAKWIWAYACFSLV